MIADFGLSQRTYEVNKLSSPLELDGYLNEDFWSNAQLATDFIVNYPKFGDTSNFVSKCYMVYAEDAIYIGGEFHDPEPDSISYSLSQRDDVGNADWMAVSIDTYGNKQRAFYFFVTAAGVEVDGLMVDDNLDLSWNTVWKSKVQRQHYGYSVEIKIPYSAIRFPNREVQHWKVNFKRSVRRKREESYWSPVDPTKYGEIQQAGSVEGIRGIQPPLRLSFTPYLTGYYEKSSGQAEGNYRLNGGLDLKYGLTEAFTLDMTLIPDFGQARSDNLVLNLSPFEVQFDENRAFFTEGTDLFGIGDVFYSRRVGGRPYGANSVQSKLSENEVLITNPQKANLLNASKISGRTKNNLGIGVFNAVEARSFATVYDKETGLEREVETNPLTNYNIVSLSKPLKNNSYVNLLNSNVQRAGDARNANVTVAQSNIFSKDRDYAIFTGVRVSDVQDKLEHSVGHTAFVDVSRVQGQHNYGFNYNEISDKFDPNDLGYLARNNFREYGVFYKYFDFKPKRNFLRRWSGVSLAYKELYAPALFETLRLSGFYRKTYKNFLTVGADANIYPLGSLDHFEARSAGNPVKKNAKYDASFFYSSDYSKPFALDISGYFEDYIGWDQRSASLGVSPRLRVSDKWFLVLDANIDYLLNDFGYVRPIDYESDEIILGERNRNIITNTFTSEFIFTNRMGIDIRVRHNWQNVDYHNFHALGTDGDRVSTAYTGRDSQGQDMHDINFNAFSIDLNYRWVFLPGSELRLVYKNNILTQQSDLAPNYFTSVGNLFDYAQTNSFSFRLLVFIDALYFKEKGDVL
ncbi:DUF5916 domain-containing protein [Lishizhenia sp.]|uniref:DUF5916 domain-containing protein n=1 Tax=Lishizhenia sp. TaxID=2497594 RepID=UPI00299D9EE0|nr:DUF5916 domain-containing protein [Lishizhenia sp.]MDX1445213.1 DUF5916 domain-containing protein [Lishizhenia sp.]